MRVTKAWTRVPEQRGGENTPEQQAALDSTWGFGPDGWWYRRALPAVAGFPTALRECGGLMGVTEFWHPPYISASPHSDKTLTFMICGADGWRAGFNHETGDKSACIYPDSAHMPERWKEIVADALREVRERWPDHSLILTDDEVTP